MQDDLPQEVCAQDPDLLLLHKWEGEPAGPGNFPEHLGEAVPRAVEEKGVLGARPRPGVRWEHGAGGRGWSRSRAHSGPVRAPRGPPKAGARLVCAPQALALLFPPPGGRKPLPCTREAGSYGLAQARISWVEGTVALHTGTPCQQPSGDLHSPAPLAAVQERMRSSGGGGHRGSRACGGGR